MIKTYPDSEIYVYCPAGVVTGGAELLHQLVSILNDNEKNAYLIYYGESTHDIPNEYSSYNLKQKPLIEVKDSSNNIEVIYEGRFDLAFKNKNTQKILWWLSVDNFYKCSVSVLKISDFFSFSLKYALKAFKARIWKLMHGISPFRSKVSIKRLRNLDVLHAYQSEYAQNFLQSMGFREMLPLKDFINDEHTYKISNNRKNIILYNPKKGIRFTRKLIKAAPQFNWVPLQGMTRSELIKAMKEAKVYIDFGNHPGKDRLPRECAMNGCCIITGRQGSADFFEDVSVYNKYKFDNKKRSISNIIDQISYIFDNYEKCIEDFEFYRNQISKEKSEFITDTLRIFS